VVGAVELLTESSMGVLVLKGLGLGCLLVMVVLVLSGDWWCEGVVVQVPSGRRELVPGRQVVKLIEGVGVVGGSQVGS
jgi:hypothetical protein